MSSPGASEPSALPKAHDPFPLGGREFISLLAMMMALNALSIDSMLPALPQIGQSLGAADTNDQQYVVSTFLGGLALGSLAMGPLADRYGRKIVLLGNLVAHIVISLGCALVTDFSVMLMLRFLHGFATAGLGVIPSTIIRDRFEGDEMARYGSLVGLVFMAVPIIAPTMGQLVLYFAEWRWIFGAMAILGVVVTGWMLIRLPETLKPEHKMAINPVSLMTTWRSVIANRDAIGYVLGSSVVMGALFGYINSSQQIFDQVFDAAALFPYAFAIVAGTMALANWSNSRIVERFGARPVSHSALCAFLALSILQVVAAYSGRETMAVFLMLIALNMGLIGFTGANFGSIAMQPFAATAGSAASFQTFVRMGLGAGIGAFIGQFFDGTTGPVALGFLICGLMALALVAYSERGKLFRRRSIPAAHR